MALQEEEKGGKAKILIAEGDRASRRLLREQVSALGHMPITAEDGILLRISCCWTPCCRG